MKDSLGIQFISAVVLGFIAIVSIRNVGLYGGLINFLVAMISSWCCAGFVTNLIGSIVQKDKRKL
jgi:hypothetical protein